MQKKLIIILSACFLALPASVAQNHIIDEVIWVIGDEAILKSEVEEQIQQIRMSPNKANFDDKDLFCLVPEQLAVQKLLLNQAAIDSLEVNADMVNAQVEQRVEFFISELGSRERVEEYFRKSLPEIRTELQEMLGEQMKAQMAQQKIVGEIKVTPADVRAFFNSLPQDSLPIMPEQVELQMIAMNPVIPETEIERVKGQLQGIKERIESGDMQFDSMARLYSEDPGSAANGGELGFMGRGQLVPEYASVAFALQDPTKVSRIVESEFGFHIIQLIERRGDRINTRHILMKPEISLAAKNVAVNRLDSLGNDIRAGKIPFDKAAFLFSQDKDTRMNEGIMTNPRSGSSRWKMDEIPANLRAVVDTLAVGGISAPVAIKNERGKDMIVILRLKNKIAEHPISTVEDYQELREQTLEQKKAEKFDKWIQEKLARTYVNVREEWRDCEFTHKGWVK
ncbi:MAG: peptidylprolyl isomerase [Prevotellaceae bacterium]|jgi:peptidyl-prolyl cis-trans isomerase SurA|nr:peptidylprolyl isomerase [Prevotellaceae bacterium]